MHPPFFLGVHSERQAVLFSHQEYARGAWVAQLVKRPTLAQVMILQFTSSSPTFGSVLTAHSLEPASDAVSPSLFAPLRLTFCLSLSKMNKH